MTEISSLQNPLVKDVIRLRDRKHRDRLRRIVIDGARELSLAIGSGVRMLQAFVCEPLCRSQEARQALAILPASGAEVIHVTDRVFAKLAFGDRAEGVLGVAETPDISLDSVAARMTGKRSAGQRDPLIAVLEAVEKPGNLGAVLRSADGAGVSALIAADPRTDLFNPNAIRASLGTIFTMPVASADSAETLAWLRREKLAIYVARVDGAASYAEVDYRRPAAIVLGSEAEGLTDAWRADDITAIRLPMLGVADSLNVSATAAVLFYEALRQRGHMP